MNVAAFFPGIVVDEADRAVSANRVAQQGVRKPLSRFARSHDEDRFQVRTGPPILEPAVAEPRPAQESDEQYREERKGRTGDMVRMGHEEHGGRAQDYSGGNRLDDPDEIGQ